MLNQALLFENGSWFELFRFKNNQNINRFSFVKVLGFIIVARRSAQMASGSHQMGFSERSFYNAAKNMETIKCCLVP